MDEEPIQLPQANDKLKEIDIVLSYITLELKKEGIDVIRNNIDGTIITDKEVPENLILTLCEYAKNKDFPIKFSTV